MVQSQFSLTWDSYKSSVCSGFSSFQQNGDFVDMTLAADGHFVKVHQMLIALASPYLKDLITSAPCQHPVLFLNNVSHQTLCLLLEYIYTGQVLVRADHLTAFAEAAKALHIKGLENIAHNESTKSLNVLSQAEEINTSQKSTVQNVRIPATDMSEQLPQAAKRIYIKKERRSMPAIKSDSLVTLGSKDDTHDMLDMLDDSSAAEDNGVFMQEHSTSSNKSEMDANDPKSTNLQFTVSIRGSLQMILNRYLYNLISSTLRLGLRRWRCVEYRNNKCKAFVITKGNVVLKRGNLHNHSFHDKKILDKMQKNTVFSALDDLENYKQKKSAAEDSDVTMEPENFVLDGFENEMDVKTTAG